VAHSRQSCVSKLRAARAVLEMQASSKTDEETEMPASPGSSDSPHSGGRKTTDKKSALAQKQALSSTETLVVKYMLHSVYAFARKQ